MPSVTPRTHPKSKRVEPFDQLLRRFKKACERKGIIQECRDRQYYSKPNYIKNQKNQALKRKKKIEAKRVSQALSTRRRVQDWGPLG
jgi:small subunit ribosomal protein S21